MSCFISCAACGAATEGQDLCGTCREVVREYNQHLIKREDGDITHVILDESEESQ